jgi:hypothetical protein
VLIALGTGPAPAAELRETFDAGALDLRVWNPCQTDMRLVGFGEENGKAVARAYMVTTIDEGRGNAECGAAAAPGSRVQRNELRLADRKRYGHSLGDPHWYALTFRMSGDIPVNGSVRWITAQWKDDGAWPHAYSQSPFLAQRYDSGVLHVTVQSDRCRCVIASAPGNPDARTVKRPVHLPATMLAPVAPLHCYWHGNEPCQAPGLRLYAPSAAAPSSLPDPRDRWVKMMYYVRGGPDGDGRIDVYADGRFIVRAEGAIGYRGGTPGRVKFKFGAYRDRQPGTARMAVDEFCLSRTAAACMAEPDD